MKIIYHIFKNIELNIRSFFPLGFIQESEILFFPGCSLTSSNPELVNKVYSYLKELDSSTGIWSACCGRPLTQFVSKKSGKNFQDKLIRKMKFSRKITVITACGNCYTEFKKINNSSVKISVISLYDILSENFWKVKMDSNYHIHHPCPARRDDEFFESFQKLIKNSNIKYDIDSMDNHRLSCCLINNERALERIDKNRQNRFLTYCAHCVKQFQSKINTIHILQLLFNDKTLWKRNNLVKQLYNSFKLKKLN